MGGTSRLFMGGAKENNPRSGNVSGGGVGTQQPATMRSFGTGATRSSAEGKPDYSGYLSPLAIEGFGRYMLKHQLQADGSYRSSRNWKKGIPMKAYVESLWRHFRAFWDFVDFWLEDDNDFPQAFTDKEIKAIREDLYGLMFNVQGFAHEFEKRVRAQEQAKTGSVG